MHRLLTFFAIFATFAAAADNWPNWRGPTHNGASSERDLPTTFSKTENVKWTAPMPGSSAATPIVWGDKVFVSSTDTADKSLLSICLNRADGKILWQDRIKTGVLVQDRRSNFSAPSPVTNGELVIFFFGNGDMLALKVADGSRVWHRNIQKDYGQFSFLWTFSSSPTLVGDQLFLQVLQRDSPVKGRGAKGNKSFLLSFDVASGKENWKYDRPSRAKAEALEAFSTPIPYSQNGRDELIVVGGDCLTGHNPTNGRELWRWGTYNPTRIGHWRLVPTPVVGGGVILCCAPKGAPIYAIKAGAKGVMEGENGLAWRSEGRTVSTDVATPLFYEEHFYVLNSDGKTLYKIVPATGEEVGSVQLGNSKLEASPTAADGKIYVVAHSGDVYVVDAKSLKILHRTAFGDDADRTVRASVAISQGNLYIRAGAALYCIE